jgi:SSS family solute:Na+ symporter
MFVVCSVVLVGVSLMTPAPDPKRLAGLTFATVDDKIETITVGGPPMRKPAHETPTEHVINVVFSLLLLGTVVGLWIYFR